MYGDRGRLGGCEHSARDRKPNVRVIVLQLKPRLYNGAFVGEAPEIMKQIYKSLLTPTAYCDIYILDCILAKLSSNVAI